MLFRSPTIGHVEHALTEKDSRPLAIASARLPIAQDHVETTNSVPQSITTLPDSPRTQPHGQAIPSGRQEAKDLEAALHHWLWLLELEPARQDNQTPEKDRLSVLAVDWLFAGYGS